MVTFIPAGRLGNFLFECATSLAYALDYNLPYSTPKVTDNPKWNPIYFNHLIHPELNINAPKVYIRERHHGFQSLPYNDNWRGMDIVFDGYWQTEKYFKHRRAEILSLFELPYDMKSGVVSVHVRRGDYVYLRNKHPEVTPAWYMKAMEMFPGATFKFYSDDIPWCRENFGHMANVEFSDGRDEMSDLIDASQCEHHINSSSTFSWWIAWLNRNENKKIVTPKLWFVENYHLDTSDIIPREWIKL